MHNFKAGDEVIVKNIEEGKHTTLDGSMYFNEYMIVMIGQKFRISSVSDSSVYINDGDDYCWQFLPEWIELANKCPKVYEDGKIDFVLLKELACVGGYGSTTIYSDGSGHTRCFQTNKQKLEFYSLDDLNILYEKHVYLPKQQEQELLSSKKDEIDAKIKQLEDDFKKNVEALRKQLEE